MAWYLRLLVDTIRERVLPMYVWIVRLRNLTHKLLLLPACFCKDVEAAAWSHSFAGMVCSQGTSQDAPSSVAAEDILVYSFGQSCEICPFF